MKIQNVNTFQAYNNTNSIKKASTPSFSGIQASAQKAISSGVDIITEPSPFKALGKKILSAFEGKELLMVSKDNVRVGLFKTPKNLTNHLGDINIKQGVDVKGTYDAAGGIISKGSLAKSGTLNAGGNIFVQDSPSVAGKIISKDGDVHIAAKAIDGAEIEGRCVSIQSDATQTVNQAIIKAKEDADIFAPLEASMITGEDVKIYSDANIKNSFISGKRVFVDSKMESTTISAKLLELGENASLGKNTKIMADEIKDYRIAK